MLETAQRAITATATAGQGQVAGAGLTIPGTTPRGPGPEARLNGGLAWASLGMSRLYDHSSAPVLAFRRFHHGGTVGPRVISVAGATELNIDRLQLTAPMAAELRLPAGTRGHLFTVTGAPATAGGPAQITRIFSSAQGARFLSAAHFGAQISTDLTPLPDAAPAGLRTLAPGGILQAAGPGSRAWTNVGTTSYYNNHGTDGRLWHSFPGGDSFVRENPTTMTAVSRNQVSGSTFYSSADGRVFDQLGTSLTSHAGNVFQVPLPAALGQPPANVQPNQAVFVLRQTNPAGVTSFAPIAAAEIAGRSLLGEIHPSQTLVANAVRSNHQGLRDLAIGRTAVFDGFQFIKGSRGEVFFRQTSLGPTEAWRRLDSPSTSRFSRNPALNTFSPLR